jgi:S-formylglutathione hydrolase FrmB
LISPLNITVGEGEDDLGSGAGFYVDATEPQWTKRHYNMYTFVSKTLPEHIEQNFPSVMTTLYFFHPDMLYQQRISCFDADIAGSVDRCCLIYRVMPANVKLDD